MKGINKHILDFEILELNNIYNIYFLDSSYYYEIPETPIVKIVVPGYNYVLSVNIIPNKINIFNSSKLGITNVLNNDDFTILPDGLYSITYQICPYDQLYKTKHYIRTDNISCKLDLIYSKLDLDTNCLEETKKELLNIQLLIDSSKANARINNTKKAQKDFELFCKKINRLYNVLCLSK